MSQPPFRPGSLLLSGDNRALVHRRTSGDRFVAIQEARAVIAAAHVALDARSDDDGHASFLPGNGGSSGPNAGQDAA